MLLIEKNKTLVLVYRIIVFGEWESRKTNQEAIVVGNQVRNDEDLNLGSSRSKQICFLQS